MSTLGGPYGLIRDIPNGKDWDIRDRVAFAPTIAAQGRPNRAPYMKNQRQHGACTAFMRNRMFRMALKKAGLPDFDASELYAYYYNRVYSGLSPTVDSGASIRGSIDAGRHKGACREAWWTYANADGYLHVKPEAYADEDAQQHQILEAFTIPNTPDMIRATLAEGFGVGIGVTVFRRAFETAARGDVQMPQNDDVVTGAHAIVLDGWNDNTGRYDWANSWSESWGAGGFGTMPYDYPSRYGFDLWGIRVPESPAPAPTTHEVTATVGFDLRTLFSGENLQNVRVDGAEVWRRA